MTDRERQHRVDETIFLIGTHVFLIVWLGAVVALGTRGM